MTTETLIQKKGKKSRYVLGDNDFLYFERTYGVSRSGLDRLIHRLEELDDLVSERRLNTLLWEPIGKGVSHITQAAEAIGLSYQKLMAILPCLEGLNRELKERSFAMFLKKYRRTFGFTAKEIAEKTHISLGFIISIEIGDYFPMPEKAERIAKALGLTGKSREMYFQVYRKERGCRSLASRFDPSKKEGLGSMLMKVRTSAGLSQSELFNAGIISDGYLCKIERGDAVPSLKILNKLIKFYALRGKEADKLFKIFKAEKAEQYRNNKCKQSYRGMQVQICKDSVGGMLRSLRERRGFPQKMLADQLGVHYSLVSCWESNTKLLRPGYVNGIEEFLGLSEQEKNDFLEKIKIRP